LLLKRHPDLFRDALGRDVLGMNQRDDALQFQIAEGMIAHGAGSFGSEALVPVVRMHAITDLDFVHVINVLMIKAAIAEQHFISSKHRGKERRFVCVLPSQKLFQKSDRFFSGVNAERKTHEIRVRHQPGQKIDIVLSEWPQT